MLFSRLSTRAAIVAVLMLYASQAHATTEICGNSIDDDGNGLTDEGCYPSLTTGVCESPLSCADTGIVSWTTGSLHYDLPPDVNPHVPYGPGIGFRRFYTSMYNPAGANPTSVNHTPLGPNWQHTYMTWLYAYNNGTTNFIVVHTSQGRDVKYTDAGACGSYECYTPQAGDHVLSLKYDPTNAVYLLQLLTGETLKYNSWGQIVEIWDTVAPTPNKVLITWTGTSNGNVSTVTDASGERRLLFAYTNNLLSSVAFQLLVSGTWTTQHTTTYDYTNGVTRDATSQWFVPQDSTEWFNLLVGTGIPSPTNMWKLQELSGNLADSIGATTLTAFGTTACRAYAQTVAGWSRKAVTLVEGSTTCKWATSSTFCNPATTPCAVFVIAGLTATPSASSFRDMFVMGDINGARAYLGKSFSSLVWHELWNGSTEFSAPTTDTSVHPWVMSTIPAQSFTGLNVDGATSTPPWSVPATTGTFTLGSVGGGALTAGDQPAAYLYAAAWNNASLTSTQQQVLESRIKNGPGLSQVTIGGQLAQQYVYNSAGYLTGISDGGGQQYVSFAYSSTTGGQVDQVTTTRGTIGFEYASTRTGCTGNTALYFNLGNASGVCSVDSDCGTGFMCGGKTDSGSTGRCFLAGRCLTTATVNGESVITNVAPLGPGGGSCSGACADVMQYVWTGTGTGNVNVTGREDAVANYTSMVYNTNGLPTQIGYGDTNADPTDGGTNRTEYLFYDTTYPGRLAEVRRASDLDANASSCSATNTTGCQRTIYCYGSSCSASCAADNQLCTLEQDGTTLNSTGANVAVSSKITYVHDSKGRVSEIDGAVSGVKTIFDYYAPASQPLTDYFLQDSKIYKDATTFLQPQITTYDFWGNPTSLKAPDGNFTCDTYDTARGFLSSRRHAMAAQTSCTTVNSADITTTWSRDSALRLTQLQRPDGSYVTYSYDRQARLSTTTRRDAIGTAGDHTTLTYTPDSQVSEVDVYNAVGTLTAKQPYTYFASRRLQDIVNPVNSKLFTGLIYDAAGKLTEVDGASSLSKTVEHFDGAPGRDGRVSSEERFKTSSTSDTWTLLYAWIGAQSQVTDGDSKVTGSPRDDLGRLVKLSSPDMSGPTVNVYDAAGRLTTTVEVLGGGANQQTHTFTYDFMGRRLNDNYQGTCATTGTAHPEIQRTYDALPTGVTCPMTGGCNNLSGRLSYVITTLMCSSTYSSTDGALDQFTFYSYDDNGRVVEEYITDDSGRVADTKFAYTLRGELSQVTTPSSAIINWVYGSTGNNSDTDLVTSISRGTLPGTTVIESVGWNPYGPLQQYTTEATIGGTKLRNVIDRNAAYRITTVHGALQDSIEHAKVAITEDAMGRVASRVYTPHDPTLPGLFDSYFTYDEQSRVVCESTVSGACPTSGSTLKNNHDQSDPFRAPGDWKEILRPIAGSSGGTINNFNTTGTAYGTAHQVTDINQSNGTPAFGHTAMAYDARGLRSYDDNTTTLTNDRRDYTYDARHNLVNVRGQYYTGGAWHYYDVASSFGRAPQKLAHAKCLILTTRRDRHAAQEHLYG